MNEEVREEVIPSWFNKWKSNDFFHFRLKVGRIEERVNISLKLSIALLGIVIAGFITLAVTL